MTDQTQTTTEPVSEIDHAIAVIASFSSYGYGHHNVGAALGVLKKALTTPQPLAIGLDRQRAIAAMSIELEKHPAFPDAVKALVWCSRLYEALALAAPAEVPFAAEDACLACNSPTPASVDWNVVGPKLVEAARGVLEWDKARGYRMPYRVRDPIYAALDLAAAQPEGK